MKTDTDEIIDKINAGKIVFGPELENDYSSTCRSAETEIGTLVLQGRHVSNCDDTWSFELLLYYKSGDFTRMMVDASRIYDTVCALQSKNKKKEPSYYDQHVEAMAKLKAL